jgi:hypothetical protein
MSAPNDPKKPIPSAAEINAYLELSAARTKKRLTLAFEPKAAPPKPAARDRKLPVARSNTTKLPGSAPATEAAAATPDTSKPKPSKG